MCERAHAANAVVSAAARTGIVEKRVGSRSRASVSNRSPSLSHACRRAWQARADGRGARRFTCDERLQNDANTRARAITVAALLDHPRASDEVDDHLGSGRDAFFGDARSAVGAPLPSPASNRLCGIAY
jgi:hypothetical protein